MCNEYRTCLQHIICAITVTLLSMVQFKYMQQEVHIEEENIDSHYDYGTVINMHDSSCHGITTDKYS